MSPHYARKLEFWVRACALSLMKAMKEEEYDEYTVTKSYVVDPK